VFIDDATGKLMQMRFVPSETTEACFMVVEDYLRDCGRPVALAIVLGPMADMARHSDKHSIFRINRPEVRNGHAMTQFGRALAELNIEILCANSSQAKGRVERANRILQDRLVKELRLAGISDMAAGNAFLPGFMARHNERFACHPARSDDLHRPPDVPASRLSERARPQRHRSVCRDIRLSRSAARDPLEGHVAALQGV
jgi:hypothetical protein